MNATSDRLALIRAVVTQPGEDVPRLAYADLADEGATTEAERAYAEFVRAQVGLATLGPPHKKTCYPEQPTAMTSHGDRHYSFTGYVGEGFQVGNRVDILVHRPLRVPRMVYGFRVYKVVPSAVATAARELDVYVRLDAGSKPWAGTDFAARADDLRARFESHWRRPACGECGGSGGDGGHAWDRGMVGQCHACRGTGSTGPLSARTRAEVEAERRNAVAGGCCDRFADNKGCDCLERAIVVTWVRGFPVVAVRLEDAGGERVDCPSCFGLRRVAASEGDRQVCCPTCHGTGLVHGPWDFRPDWLAWACRAARECGASFAVTGRDPSDTEQRTNRTFAWVRDTLGLPASLNPSYIPSVVFDGLKGGELRPVGVRHYHSAAEAHAALDAELTEVVARAAWPQNLSG